MIRFPDKRTIESIGPDKALVNVYIIVNDLEFYIFIVESKEEDPIRSSGIFIKHVIWLL